jgi:hypothetical protein
MTTSLSPARAVTIDRSGHAAAVIAAPEASLQKGKKLKAKKVRPLPKATEAQVKTNTFDIWRPMRGIDEGLMNFTQINPSGAFLVNFAFEANDVEFYSVLSVSNRPTCLVLLQIGIRSAGEAIELLRALNMGHLIEDNSALTNALYRNRVNSQTFNLFANEFIIDGKEVRNVIDALSIYKFKGFREADEYYTLPERVLDGKLNINDLKLVGWRHMNIEANRIPLYRAFKAIHRGTSKYNAEQLRDMLDLIESDPENTMSCAEAIKAAERYGADYVLAQKLRSNVA